MILTVDSVGKSFGAELILEEVSFIIEEKEKAAMVGINGAGKTTLLKIITGELDPDAGRVSISAGAALGYLAQMEALDDSLSIYEELKKVFLPVMEIENQLRMLEKGMSKLEGSELASSMERYSRLSQDFEDKRGYEYESRLRGVLKGLGFSDSEGSQRVGTLSGGQQTRVSLGKLLLTQPELLLLDEPTNHLDMESVQWLEDFLKAYPGSVLVVSHDRYFLDRVATKVIELDNKKSKVYKGNYTDFIKTREQNRQIQLHHYESQRREIKRQEEVIKTLKSYNREKSIKRAESREKLLSRVERLERPRSEEKMRIRLTPRIESGNDVLLVDRISKAFGGVSLFQPVSFEIKKGDKVALIGPNGIGKTTLFKIIMKLLSADSGRVREGVNVKIGYYDQAQQQLSPEKTVLSEMHDAYPRLTVGEIRNTLAALMFTGDDVFKTIESLSGGEKGRVALAKIMLGGANFLILDEPTNHLDINSREILEETIRNYDGTLLYISHDRYFINNTAEKILELSQDGIETFIGNYDYYLMKKNEQAETVKETKTVSENSQQKRNKNQSQERKDRALLQRLEKDIIALEEKLAQMEAELMKEEVYTDHLKAMEVVGEKTRLEAELENTMEHWAELAEQA